MFFFRWNSILTNNLFSRLCCHLSLCYLLWSVSLAVCVTVCVCVGVFVLVCGCMCLCLYISLCLSVCMPAGPSVCPSVRPSIRLSVIVMQQNLTCRKVIFLYLSVILFTENHSIGFVSVSVCVSPSSHVMSLCNLFSSLCPIIFVRFYIFYS